MSLEEADGTGLIQYKMVSREVGDVHCSLLTSSSLPLLQLKRNDDPSGSGMEFSQTTSVAVTLELSLSVLLVGEVIDDAVLV